MEHTTLGASGIQVSRVGLGTWAIGGWKWGGTDEQDSVQTILAALDMGINLIDTAPAYGNGRSEELVGKALAAYGRRDEVVIATKTGIEVLPNGEVRRNTSSSFIRRDLENSLRRLCTEYIDVYQVHWPDPLVPVEEVAEVLVQLRDEGKIRAIGVSNFSPEQMQAWLRVAPLDTDQPPYNLFERGIEADVLPFCRDNGVAVLAYGSLCRGLLTGKMSLETTFSGDDLRQTDPKFQPPRYEQYLRAVQRLSEIAGGYGKSVTELAVRWVLDQPGVSTALWGARRPSQLDPVRGVFGWHLSAADLQRIDDILQTVITDPVGPEFMAPPARETK
ncbi:aldo/keto reductase [Alicyclobacillus cycloheptanicus]|uniref:Aryl-alcohol dehydrogenase-like predicted oxidoreductase n=1 Tax=Alicyclobacillus cycloheptanicus TaxID=1457 RepID=A0ABT9XHI0_9BACL|nr:aldo/keto reductase [Alicyclobacillus cycloheptanicus]MDQ0189773.1 aryl-alcohol dehydrogenase-like predicted oxidoreductase [Alicyclobacillus cycloheptanicus]WDM01976.1 aldo/keto reductase [Alicyclobacillus cycloheptanicus]